MLKPKIFITDAKKLEIFYYQKIGNILLQMQKIFTTDFQKTKSNNGQFEEKNQRQQVHAC